MPAYSSELSRYKIAIMTKHGQENWYWYCFISDNNKPYQKLKDEMISRLKNYLHSGKKPCTVQSLIMYERTAFVEKISPSVLI